MELNSSPMDLRQQMDGLESLFRTQAEEKHLDIRFENRYSSPRQLLADGLRLNQVLVNIIGNAVKFTEQGGITVKVEPLRKGQGQSFGFPLPILGLG